MVFHVLGKYNPGIDEILTAKDTSYDTSTRSTREINRRLCIEMDLERSRINQKLRIMV